MDMNWVLISVIVIFLIGMFVGWKRGIIKIAVSLASMIISIIACMFLTPVLCHVIKTDTDVYMNLNTSIYNIIIKNDNYNKAYDDADSQAGSHLASSVGVDVSVLEQYEDLVEKYVLEVSTQMNLPKSITESMEVSLLTDNIKKMFADKTVSVKNMVAAIFAARLAELALNAIVYTTVFVVMFIILKIVLAATGLIASLPLIRQANHFVGFLFGILESLIVVWVLFAVITACSNFEWGNNALLLIGKNSFLEFLYEKNIILKTILG